MSSLRASKSNANGTTYYLYDGDQPVEEFSPNGTLTADTMQGISGPIVRNDSARGTSFYAFDERGNVAQCTNASGQVTSTDLYDAYGKLITGNPGGDPNGYGAKAGYYTDSETGLLLLTHRFYDPAQGRFLTRDPLGPDGGINLYSYTANNPGNRWDPNGYNWALPGGGTIPIGTGLGFGGLGFGGLRFGAGLLGGAGIGELGAGAIALAPAAGVVILAGAGIYAGYVDGQDIASLIPAQDGLPASPIMENRRGSRGVATLRRQWEKLNGKPWPVEPNGDRYQAEHKVPLTDGGADDGSNVEPLTKEEHTQHHKDQGDYQRWGGKSGKGKSCPQSE